MSGQTRTSSTIQSESSASASQEAGAAASSSAAAAPRAPIGDAEPAQPSPTQLAIQGILKSGPLEFHQIQTLANMEVRKMPSGVTADQREPGMVPRKCCFDAVNQAWTANKLCARCMLLNQVLQVRENGDKSEMIRGILDSAFNCTDCISTTERTGQTPTLPRESLDLVIEAAIAEMRRTHDGTLVAALLHVSRDLRCKVAQAFTPVRLFALRSVTRSVESELRVPRELEEFIWDAVHWHFFRDFSHKPREPNGQGEAPAMHDSRFVKAAAGEWLEELSTVSNDKSTNVRASVTFTLKESAAPCRRTSVSKSWWASDNVGYPSEAYVNVRDGCEAVRLAIGHVVDEQSESTRTWNRFANPYLRALRGALGPPNASAEIEVKCWLHDLGLRFDAESRSLSNRSWLFETEFAL